MEYIDKFMDSNEYYNIFEKKVEPLETYTDLMKFFVGKRLLPILCSDLNDYQISDYRRIPTPSLNGQENVYCLANDDTILTDRYALHYSPVNNIWDCIAMCKVIGYNEKQLPVYDVIGTATLKYNPESGNVFFSYQSSKDPKFSADIKYFNEKTASLLVDLINKFNANPLIQSIREYGSIDRFKHGIVKNINDKFKHDNLGQFKAYLEKQDMDINLRLKENEESMVDDEVNLFSYNTPLNQASHGENSFYNGELVLRDEWRNSISTEKTHQATTEEKNASALFVETVNEIWPNASFVRQNIE